MPNYYCLKRQQFPKNPCCTHKRPVLVQRTCRPIRHSKSLSMRPSIWQDIVAEDDEISHYLQKEKLENRPVFEHPSSYLKRAILPQLVPAFEKMCAITIKQQAVMQEVKFFNFLDLLAELLYNTNNRHKERKHEWLSIHQVYQDEHRPHYPYAMFMSQSEAAVLIQSNFRGFIVRTHLDLDEMKEEHEKILAGIEKQKKCYEAYKDDIENICRRRCKED